MNVSSLLGDLLLNAVVHRGDCWRRRWGPGRSRGSRWDVGLASGCYRLPGWDKRLSGGNGRLAWRRSHPLWRQRCLGGCGRGHGCGGGFGRNRKYSPLSDWWSDGGGGSLVVPVRDVVVMIWRLLVWPAWSRGVNNHLRNS